MSKLLTYIKTKKVAFGILLFIMAFLIIFLVYLFLKPSAFEEANPTPAYQPPPKYLNVVITKVEKGQTLPVQGTVSVRGDCNISEKPLLRGSFLCSLDHLVQDDPFDGKAIIKGEDRPYTIYAILVGYEGEHYSIDNSGECVSKNDGPLYLTESTTINFSISVDGVIPASCTTAPPPPEIQR